MGRMHYEHPLAYLLAVEGAALMRAFNGEHDREFVETRLAEVRRLLDAPQLKEDGVNVERVDVSDGYARWAATYDNPNNDLLKLDIPIVREMLADFPAGTVLDAACGTGRLSAVAADTGHRVVGVDASSDMLAKAGERLPDAVFHLGDTHDLPLDDASVNGVVCGLALTHVPSLQPVFAEFARVLAPGGRIVLSEVHPDLVAWGSIPPVWLSDGRPARIATYRHRTVDYLRAALRFDLNVDRCEEVPINRSDEVPPMPDELNLPQWDDWPWGLVDLAPRAARAASWDVAGLLVWQFSKP